MKESTIFDNQNSLSRELWAEGELKSAIVASLVNEQCHGRDYSGRAWELLTYGPFVPYRVLGDPLQIADVYKKLDYDALPTTSDYKTAQLIAARFHLLHFHNEYSLSVRKNYAINPALFGHAYKSLSITRSNIRGNIYWQAYLEGETNQLRESVRCYNSAWHGALILG